MSCRIESGQTGLHLCKRCADNSLQRAVFDSDKQAIDNILAVGIDINTRGTRFGTALTVASGIGNEEIVRFLLDRGACINTMGGRYNNALSAANYRGYQHIVDLLLEKNGAGNAQALRLAAFHGDSGLVTLFLNHGVPVIDEEGDALMVATSSKECSKETVEKMLATGLDINYQGGYFGFYLQAAAYQGLEEVARVLLDRGADINLQGGTYGNALQAAACMGRTGIVKLLLDEGADVHVHGGRYGDVFHAALYVGVEVWRDFYLLEQSVPGCTAEHIEYAQKRWERRRNGQEGLLRLLVESGARLRNDPEERKMAIQMAISLRSQEILVLVIEACAADIEADEDFTEFISLTKWHGGESLAELLKFSVTCAENRQLIVDSDIY